ncbi:MULTISPECIES: CidA/LrgA family protein [Bacillaceae]|nr:MULTISPECIES: CidA/LrgA family protein [Bacillaceae]
MEALRVICHIAILYIFYYIGIVIQSFLNLPIPGSVIGMLLFFTALTTNLIKPAWVKDGAHFLIKYLPLFFIPATVGMMNYFDLFFGKGFLLILIVLFSTLLVMIIAGRLSQRLAPDLTEGTTSSDETVREVQNG